MNLLDIKEKIPSDILFFCYNMTTGAFVKLVQSNQFNPEIEKIMASYIQEVQTAMGMVMQGNNAPQMGGDITENEQGQLDDMVMSNMMSGYD